MKKTARSSHGNKNPSATKKGPGRYRKSCHTKTLGKTSAALAWQLQQVVQRLAKGGAL